MTVQGVLEFDPDSMVAAHGVLSHQGTDVDLGASGHVAIVLPRAMLTDELIVLSDQQVRAVVLSALVEWRRWPSRGTFWAIIAVQWAMLLAAIWLLVA